MNRTDTLKIVSRGLNFTLPQSYIEFLLNYDGYQNFEHNSYKGKFWKFASLIKEKGNSILNDSFKKSYLQIVNTIYENKFIDPVEYNSIKNGFPIAYDNGDYLFMDNQTLELNILWHDNGDINKISNSFEEFIKFSKGEFSLPGEQNNIKNEFNFLNDIIGAWENIIDLGSSKLVTVMEFFKNKEISQQTNNDPSLKGTWRIIDENTVGVFIDSYEYKEGEIRFKISKCDSTFKLSGIDTEDDVYLKIKTIKDTSVSG